MMIVIIVKLHFFKFLNVFLMVNQLKMSWQVLEILIVHKNFIELFCYHHNFQKLSFLIWKYLARQPQF